MPQGIWASSNLQQNAVLQGGPVYIRSMQADGTSLFIPQNAPQQAMQQHNRKLIKPRNSYILKKTSTLLSAAAMTQAPTAPMPPGIPPQMQQKQIRPELPANIQPKISQRNLLPSDVRPSVSTQTAGGQPKVRAHN